MSPQFPRVNGDPNVLLLPLDPTTGDPFAGVRGKLGEFLRGGGPLDGVIHREMGSQELLDNGRAPPEGPSPFDWQEVLKYRFAEKTDENGAAYKPRDLRLAQDKNSEKTQDGGKTGNELLMLREWVNEDGEQKKADPSNTKTKGKLEYSKDLSQFERKRTTEWSNEKTNNHTQPERQHKPEKQADAKTPDAGRRNNGFARDRTDETGPKRAPLSAETNYGNYTPDITDGSGKEDVKSKTWKSGHEDVNRLNDGNGSSKTNAGLWTLTQETKTGGTAAFGMGMQGEIVDVIKAGPGELTLRANGLFGMETSAGGKFSLSPENFELSAGAEMRAGLFGEAGFGYRPVNWQPKIFGSLIDLSPEVEGAGRVFAGGELGGGIKAGWRLKTDPKTGKTVPEAGIEAKANAFAGGKAEGDASVGVGSVGKVGGSAAALGGVGVEGKASLGVKKDQSGRRKLKFELKAGAALGVGASFGVKGEINLEGLLSFVEGVVKGGKKAVNKVGKAFKGAADKVREGFTDFTEAIGKTATKAGEKIKAFFNKLF
jgi:hypothetical protein